MGGTRVGRTEVREELLAKLSTRCANTFGGVSEGVESGDCVSRA